MGKPGNIKVRPPKKTGRPSLYNPDEHPAQARKLTAEGKTQRDIAELFNVNPDTIQEWIKVHPAFSVAIKQGREDASDRVERALFERATGYTHDAEKIVVVAGPPGHGSSIERVKTTEHYPPDPTAVKFYLTNRRPKEWADKATLIVGEDRATRLAKARERLKKGTK